MPEVHYVTVQVKPNQVIEGFYTIANGVLTMTYGDGEPVMLDRAGIEQPVTHTLSANEIPKAVAYRLTKEIRENMMGDAVPGFSLPINYGRSGVA
jgi:hypothetical protein